MKKKTGDKRTRKQLLAELEAAKKSAPFRPAYPHDELRELEIFRKMFSVRREALYGLAYDRSPDDRFAISIMIRKRMIGFANADEIRNEVAHAVYSLLTHAATTTPPNGEPGRLI